MDLARCRLESSGFVLSEAAEYAFKCQDVYPDIVSFAAAIPNHLKSLFLIPIRAEVVVASTKFTVASKIAYETSPSGGTAEGDLFSYQTFVYRDLEPTVPSSEPGSIFGDLMPDALTKHQEYDFDENIQVPTDTSYMSDVDITQYVSYPYRTKEKPVRHSSSRFNTVIIKLALSPAYLESKAPDKIVKNARKCKVNLVNFDNPTGIFTFNVLAETKPRTVFAALVEDKHVALSCDCPFWRYNGPEYHARVNHYLISPAYGRATNPKVRDPDKKYWLCKHTYAVLKRFEGFLDEIYEELSEEDIIEEKIAEEWDRMTDIVDIPMDEFEEDVDINWEGSGLEKTEEVADEDIEVIEDYETSEDESR